MTSTEKEIDILDLLVKFVVLIKKRIIILVLFAFLGISFAFARYLIIGDSYRHMFIVSSKVLPGEFIFEFFNDLKDNFNDNDKASILAKLKLTKAEGKKLKNISCDTLRNSRNKLLRIIMITKDSASIPLLKSKILDFINKRPLTEDMAKSLCSQKKQMITEISKKLAQLDSLQKVLLIIQGSKKLSTVNLSNTEYIEFFEHRMKLEQEITELNDANTLSEYYSTSCKIPFKIFSGTIKFGLIFLFLGIIFIICLELYKVIQQKM